MICLSKSTFSIKNSPIFLTCLQGRATLDKVHLPLICFIRLFSFHTLGKIREEYFPTYPYRVLRFPVPIQSVSSLVKKLTVRLSKFQLDDLSFQKHRSIARRSFHAYPVPIQFLCHFPP